MTAIGLPSSTYRLQLSSVFTLDDAASLCDYLSRLGVGWVYLSPVLCAQPGSTHGYDVIDHSRVDQDRGGDAAFARFCRVAHGAGLGVLVDIVPNHMGVETPSYNSWWWDVLARGQASRYADAFDVDWDAANGRIRIPVLGDGTGELDALAIDNGELAYYDHRYPIAKGTAAPGDSPQQVHAKQNYELINWRRADAELNYRRFFAVNSLAAIRVEEPWVFAESHALIGEWFRLGLVDGLRVDHPDGLADPRGYLDDLARLTACAPVWVEKILEGGETLAQNWAACGTTGYDALGDFDRVFVDTHARTGLQNAQRTLGATSAPAAWSDLIENTKNGVADGILRSEVNRLARLMPEVEDAASALIDLLSVFPVYRSYLPLGAAYLTDAAAQARVRHPEHAGSIDQIARILAVPEHPAAVRFQQTSGMIMAKGVEDTAFYRYGTLTSLNEVGADPSEFSIDVHAFHARQAARQAALPATLTTLSTHDTKRGEDTRARITALSERPELWESMLSRVPRLGNSVLGNSVLGNLVLTDPVLTDPVLENLLWQAVIGAWPASRERLHGYAEKAARESGTCTNWITPNTAFEQRMHATIDAVFDDESVASAIAELTDAIAPAGYSNGLSMKLLQLTAPGIPDVYQGSELWERSLVDPDNRRPVDFAARVETLAKIDSGWLPPVDAGGAAKLLLVSRTLRLRHDHPERFCRYLPVTVFGTMNTHAVAFDRGGATSVATRLPFALERDGGWHDTWIEPAGQDLVDVLTGREYTGGRIRLRELLDRYPVALLTARDGRRTHA